MIKLTQPQLQILLQLRRSHKPLTKLQLGTTGRILDSLFQRDYIEINYQPIAAKITLNGILAVNDHIKSNPVELPEKRTHLQEYELIDLVSLYYPDRDLYYLMTTLRQAGFSPHVIGTERLYKQDKIIEMFEYLKIKLHNI